MTKAFVCSLSGSLSAWYGSGTFTSPRVALVKVSTKDVSRCTPGYGVAAGDHGAGGDMVAGREVCSACETSRGQSGVGDATSERD